HTVDVCARGIAPEHHAMSVIGHEYFALGGGQAGQPGPGPTRFPTCLALSLGIEDLDMIAQPGQQVACGRRGQATDWTAHRHLSDKRALSIQHGYVVAGGDVDLVLWPNGHPAGLRARVCEPADLLVMDQLRVG